MAIDNLISFDFKSYTLTEIFNYIEDNLSILDEECNILWANKAYYNRLGKQFGEIIGKKCYSLWHHLSSPCPNCPCVKTFKTDKTEVNDRITHEGRHFILVGIPLKTKDNKKLVFEIGREITEKKLSKEQYIEILQLKAFNSLINDFCHQLNNIFTGIYGFTQLLRKDIQNEKNEKHFIKLTDSINKGIQFLKTLERLKNIRTEEKIFDLNYLLISMKHALKELINNDNITLNISTNVSSPLIKGDVFQIRELLIELIKNAKNSILDKGTIDIKVDKIDFKVILIVKDTGVGMSDNVLKKCFEPFFTTDPSKFGLGLTIVKNIVEKMNGSLEIKSEPSLGTTVRIYLPEATLPQEQDT